MKRLSRLFYTLVFLVVLIGAGKLYDEVLRLLPKEQVFSHHVIGITLPLLNNVTSKDQLAAIIAHEISHIQLGHTIQKNHEMVMEYNADLLSFYYLKKAGFGLCGAKEWWEASKHNYLELKPESHPNYMTRAFYMNMPECKYTTHVKQHITMNDAIKVFNRLRKHIAGINRYRIRFVLITNTKEINAFAGTRYRDKR